MKRALITGITGQDGSYLTEFLLGKGYEVHGVLRRSSSTNIDRLRHVYTSPQNTAGRLKLHYGDLNDSSSLDKILDQSRPDEVYNLAAQSHVRVSFEQPIYTVDVDALGTLRLLEAVRRQNPTIRFYQASSSEMYGKVRETPQDENTPFAPRSPYGCAKAYSYWQVVNYRESYGLFACNGILFNHESPRRGENFVTRKITRAATRIKLGLQDKLFLGNLDAKRDWGFAGDYVEAMWRMLQQPEAEDFVVATGECYSVKDFLDATFERLDLDWKSHVEIDPWYLRPAEVDLLLGNAAKAREKLGWEPRTGFAELVGMMVDHDLELAREEKAVQDFRAEGADEGPS